MAKAIFGRDIHQLIGSGQDHAELMAVMDAGQIKIRNLAADDHAKIAMQSVLSLDHTAILVAFNMPQHNLNVALNQALEISKIRESDPEFSPLALERYLDYVAHLSMALQHLPDCLSRPVFRFSTARFQTHECDVGNIITWSEFSTGWFDLTMFNARVLNDGEHPGGSLYIIDHAYAVKVIL